MRETLGNISTFILKQIIDIFKNYKFDQENLLIRVDIEKARIENIELNDSIEKLICFLISAEDHRFYYHFGFDFIAILRAIRNKIFWNRNEGASTIEQQLVRVLTNNYQRNLVRKVKEIILAYSLKKKLTKKEIALIYLNIAYYGTNLEGLDKVLKRFKIATGHYIESEICAEIVARLKYPEPLNNKEKKLSQIRNRTLHITKLYEKHSSNKFLNYHGKYHRLYPAI